MDVFGWLAGGGAGARLSALRPVGGAVFGSRRPACGSCLRRCATDRFRRRDGEQQATCIAGRRCGSIACLAPARGLLTFGGRGLFVPHLATAPSWGLTPLSDQQLGSLLMWALGGVLFLVLTVLLCNAWLRSLKREGAPTG